MTDLRQVLGTHGTPTLRNANGVYMKLMNFRRFDPAFVSQGKSGLTRGNQLEGIIWNEFWPDQTYLSRVASAIQENVNQLRASGATVAIDANNDQLDGEEAVEGRLLTLQHHRRERSRKIVLAKKDAALKAVGRLICEACGFDSETRYGHHGAGVIECHHTKPVADLGDGTPTRLTDLALLCANCHRIIHARRPWLTVGELKAALSSRWS